MCLCVNKERTTPNNSNDPFVGYNYLSLGKIVTPLIGVSLVKLANLCYCNEY